MKVVDKKSNIVFVDLHSHILKDVLKSTIKLIGQYKEVYIDTLDLTDKQQKKIFYHSLILELCTNIITLNFAKRQNNSSETIVYVFEPLFYQNNNWCFVCELFNGKLSNIEVYEEAMKSIKKILPINLLHTESPWNQLIYWIDDPDSGEYQEIIQSAKALIEKNFNKDFSYEKCKRFCKKWDLTFLSEEYFNYVFVKQKLLTP